MCSPSMPVSRTIWNVAVECDVLNDLAFQNIHSLTSVHVVGLWKKWIQHFTSYDFK